MIPTAKVATGGIAGAVTILIMFGAGLLGVVIDPVTASALTTLVSFAAAYFKKDKPGKHAVEA